MEKVFVPDNFPPHLCGDSDSVLRGMQRKTNRHWERCSQNEVPKTINMGLNWGEVAPFGPKLCQNVAPRLRIIFQALLGPKNKLKA